LPLHEHNTAHQVLRYQRLSCIVSQQQRLKLQLQYTLAVAVLLLQSSRLAGCYYAGVCVDEQHQWYKV
jgi:hypothetical protein